MTLSGPSATATTVSYAVSGSPTQVADYATLAGSVTIPAFATTADIDINVIDDSATEGAETVTLTLGTITGDPQITVNGAANTATLSIGDDESTTVSVSALDPTASETGTNNGQFRVLMDNGKLAPAGGIIVSYSVAGSATNGVDYATLSGTVTIPGGSGSAVIDVTGIVDDRALEGDETVIVTITGTNNLGAYPADCAEQHGDRHLTGQRVGSGRLSDRGEQTRTRARERPTVPVVLHRSWYRYGRPRCRAT